MRRLLPALFALLAGLCLAKGVSGPEVARILNELGYEASLETESGNGYPLIFLQTGKISALLIFYDDNPFSEGFEALQLGTSLNFDPPPSLEGINAWNARNRFGKAALMEDGQVMLVADLNLDPVCDLKRSLSTFVEDFESSVMIFYGEYQVGRIR